MIRAFTILVFLGMSINAIADDSPYEANRIDALHFRESSNQFGTTINFSATARDTALDVPSTGTNISYQRHSDYAGINLVYGISDDFLVGISESYLFDSTTTASNGHDYLSLGFSEPELHVNYRYWGQLVGTNFASAYLNFIPNFGTFHNADTAQNGNNLRSNSMITAGTDIYWVVGQFEYVVVPSVNYLGAGSTESSNSMNNFNSDEFFTYNLSATARFHFQDRYYLSGSLSTFANYTVNSNYPNRTNVISSSTKNNSTINPAVNFGCKLSENSIVTLGWSYNHINQNTSNNTGFQAIYTGDYQYVTLSGHMIF